MKLDKVPFLDIVALHKGLEEGLIAVFKKALKSGKFIGGPMVESFESEFAAYCGTGYCIGVSSGTDALRFALIAAGVRPGETVVTVPNTFIATTEAISQTGAIPAFVDVDEWTYTMDVAKLSCYIETECCRDETTGRPVNKKTKSPVSALIPVHLYGQMADMDPLIEVAEKYNMVVIEDACQAHGAEYFSRKENRWKKAGAIGIAGAFSFYPGKNLGACGEGGAVTTNSEAIAQKIKMLRDHGQIRKYIHEMEGYNGRLDAIQAGILETKLGYLSGWNERRRACAAIYDELLGGIEGIVLPYTPSWAKSACHLYVIRSGGSEELARFLSGEGIDTGLHYPLPLHFQTAYEHLGYREGDFPVSERLAAEVLSLPLSPCLKRHQQERVAMSIRKFVSAPASRQR